jgi:phosphodiesterase/alkaline phosphatase D-like protein
LSRPSIISSRPSIQGGPASFRTFPKKGSKARFQIGFGGGAGYTPQHEKMWNTVAAHNPTAFLFLGDNVYIDNDLIHTLTLKKSQLTHKR